MEVGAYLVADAQALELVEPGGWIGRAARCLPWQVLFRAADPTSWLNGCRRLHRRYESKAERFLAFVGIASTLICYRRCTN